jgi:hypothetical protein
LTPLGFQGVVLLGHPHQMKLYELVHVSGGDDLISACSFYLCIHYLVTHQHF